MTWFQKMKMTRLFVTVLFFCGCTVMPSLQKSRMISVYHLIETAKYSEAKELIEEMTEDERYSQWGRLWYARGLLCQNAYREGIAKNDKSKYELYPDQLYVAYESYEKARALDRGGKIERNLPPKYVLLVNDFQELGEKRFGEKKYCEALRAFEQALALAENPVITVKADTALIYNTSIAAYKAKEWNKAKRYLGKLHHYGYSANATHLLSNVWLITGDTTMAATVLGEGISRYDKNQDLVLLLADLFFSVKDTIRSLDVLDEAIRENPGKYIFSYTKGVVLQKAGRYEKAIKAYTNALNFDPDELMTYINIATCYYNTGVEIEENARKLTVSSLVEYEKTKSAEAFRSALHWLDLLNERSPEEEDVKAMMLVLYELLGAADRADHPGEVVR